MNGTSQDAYLQAASLLLGLPIRPEHDQEVRDAFAAICAQGQLVTAFALPHDVDPAPRFTP